MFYHMLNKKLQANETNITSKGQTPRQKTKPSEDQRLSNYGYWKW